jgi:GTP cyclohydrolase I
MQDDHEKVYKLTWLFSEKEVDHEAVEQAVQTILKAVGEDPGREGLQRTPVRVARIYTELLEGYHTDPFELLNDALFEVEYRDMVLVRDIEFYSLCEHHLLPFIGRAHIAYIPRRRVIGLSKIPRVVDMFAPRLQLQERMTRQIAEFMDALLQPLGVAVVLEGLHLCATLRGLKKHSARMTTSKMQGVFRSNLATREEFLNNASRGSDPLL